MISLILIIFSLNFLLIHSSINGIDNNNNLMYKINTCLEVYNPDIDENVGESKNNCASPLITNNQYLDSSISEELLFFDNVYYNTQICVECIKLILKERVRERFFDLFNNRTTILRLDFFGILGDNIVLNLNTTNLRRLENTITIKKQIFGQMMNQSYDDIENCANRYRDSYLSNVHLIEEVFKEYQNISCANEVYTKIINNTFDAWKQALGRLLYDAEQNCFNQMQLNDTVIEAIKNICNDDDD